ncbi:MAG TPA: AEC family transporter [Methylocella sp.]|nr:AEC family transporter [Methylocella sp.]
MNNYLLLGTCFLLGILLRRSRRLPDNAAASLNGFVIHISLPALTLTYVHGLKLDTSLILPALMAWVMFGIGCGFFWLAGRALGFSRATTGGLMLTGGLANTSFIGLPMIETFYGPQFLGLGILIDQLGSYFVLSTLGILVASLYSSGHRIHTGTVIRKIVRFVPFQAFVLALLLMPFAYPVWLDDLLRRLGATLVPLALVSVGYQLHQSQVRGKASALTVGLVFKLAVAPALILLLFAGVLGAKGPVLNVTVFEAAMGPMIGACIVAIDHELDPPLLTLMVGVGIPLSFLTLPIWWHSLNFL